MNLYSQWFSVLRVGGDYKTMHVYPGTGGDTFDINFAGGYIDRAHVKALVSTGDVVTLQFSSASRVRTSRPILADETILIYRDTPKVVPLAQFSDGALLTGANLDRNAKQAVFVAAEMLDRFDTFGSSLETSVEQVSEALETANAALNVANSIRGIAEYALTKSAEAVALAAGANSVAEQAISNIESLERGTGAFSIGFGHTTVGAHLQEVVSVSMYGAKGDGVSDDTDAIQLAINSAKRIFIPDGLFIVRQLEIPSNRVIVGAGIGLTTVRSKSGYDRVWHTVVTANAASMDARIAVDSNVDTLVGDYVVDSMITDLTFDGNWENRPETIQDREQGTVIELHKVRRFRLSRVRAINGPQHCVNVRAGTGSFNKGYDYKEKYPSQYVYFEDVETDNQLYDDGITTHDSEYIWITRCTTKLSRNKLGTNPAVSNGIEIDDGSRYVWVTDCMSDGGFGGYQAKGHENTPPAHHVWFARCTAKHVHMGFVISAPGVANNDLNSYEGTVNNIFVIACTLIDVYAFSNSGSFKSEAHYLQIYNSRDVKVVGLVIHSGAVTEVNRAASFKSIFRIRGSNAGLVMDDFRIIGADRYVIDGQSLVTVEAVAERITLTNWDVDKFTAGNLLFTNALGVDWKFAGNKLRVGSPNFAIIKLGGVGGGTLEAGSWAGSGFKAPYELGDTLVGSQNITAGGSRVREGESIFSKLTAYIRSAIKADMSGANIGHDAVISVDGGTNYRVGRTQVNILSGDVTGSSCVSRYGIALRDGVNPTTVLALNISATAIVPGLDNKMTVGSPGLRFSELFSVNGNINTSDARLKSEVEGLSDRLLDAADELEIISFRWKHAVASKGDAARRHIGVIAQDAHSVLNSHGIDGLRFGLLCYDKWDAEYEAEIGDNGEPTGNTVCIREAGDMWSIRPDQFHWLLLAATRRRLKELESKLNR